MSTTLAFSSLWSHLSPLTLCGRCVVTLDNLGIVVTFVTLVIPNIMLILSSPWTSPTLCRHSDNLGVLVTPSTMSTLCRHPRHHVHALQTLYRHCRDDDDITTFETGLNRL
jgi:hypothetical protein